MLVDVPCAERSTGVNFSLELAELRTGSSVDLPGTQAQRGPPGHRWNSLKVGTWVL